MVYVDKCTIFSERKLICMLKHTPGLQRWESKKIKERIGTTLDHDKPVVYILRSENIRLLKIGYTNNIKRRLRELNSQTSGPGDWRAIALYESDDPAGEEARVHDSLWDKRVCDNREFFREYAGQAVAKVSSVLHRKPKFNAM
jgi:hypothetical protein